MSEPRDERVEELLRANERLAAEVRNLTLGYADAPRPAGMPTSRRLGRLIAERDRLRAELDAARAELDATKAHLDATRAERDENARHRAGLERQNQELDAQLLRLRSGLPGFLRRAGSRLRKR